VTRRLARGTAWFAGLVAALVALRLAGTGDLAAPPLRSLDALDAWAEERDPLTTAVALVRLVAELAVGYLLSLSVLHALAAVLRSSRAHRFADLLALPGADRLVRSGLGLGLLAATAAGADDHRAVPDTPTMERVEAAVVLQERIEPGTATMRPLGDDRSTGTATMEPLAPARPEPAGGPAEPEPSPPVPAAPTTWRVEAGESFWTFAAGVLEEAWRRPPTDDEIDPFWRALVEANRHRLVTDDPDLIHPGQVFEVPAVPPPPG
jgi:hypothetical protein